MSEKELRGFVNQLMDWEIDWETDELKRQELLALDPDVVAALRKTRAMLDRVNADLAIEPQSIVTHDQLVGMQSALYEIIGWLEKIVRLTADGWEWTE